MKYTCNHIKYNTLESRIYLNESAINETFVTI